MSKLKRMRRKRAAQKKANIRLMSLHRGMKETPESRKLLKRKEKELAFKSQTYQKKENELFQSLCENR